MRRLPAVASMFSAVLLVLTLLPQAQAQTPAQSSTGSPDPAGTAALTGAEARQALSAARSLFASQPPAGARRSKAASLVHGRQATGVLRDLWRAQPRLRGADRAAARQMLARPTDLAGDRLTRNYSFKLPTIGSTKVCNTDFCVHYTTAGDNKATPAFAAQVARTLSHVRSRLVGQLGYRAPVSDGDRAGSAGNPDGRFDVYLGNIGRIGFYGYCALDSGRNTPYCALDNDFANFPGNRLDSLRATAAHEFFHAIQFAYDANEDLWFMEGSAVWAEERVYDGVNDYRQYLRDSVITAPRIPADQDSVHNLRVYSAMLFFEHLTQTLGVVRMRQVWEAAQGRTYSLQAVRKVVSRVSSWGPFINRFGVWNSRPPGVGYAERGAYPAGSYVASTKLGIKGKRSMSTTFRRDHLTSGAVRLIPGRASTRKQRLRITINGPDTARGSVAAVQRRLPNGRTSWNQVRLNRHGDATLVQPFGKGRIRSIVVTASNASTVMRECGSYGPVSYSCGGRGAHNGVWKVSARVIR